jgi:hypothetical protein
VAAVGGIGGIGCVVIASTARSTGLTETLDVN